MKKALKKLGAGILAMAMIASLAPVTGIASLADETETGTPAATEETEKDKQEPAGKTDTDKQKETQKPSEETPKETGESETAVPKETEKPEALTPTETEAPKETEKAEVPHESEKPAEETPKEPEGTASAPKKKASAQNGTISNIKVTDGILSFDPYDGAESYMVWAGSAGWGLNSETSFEINKAIDKAIKLGNLKNSSPYALTITAYDSDMKAVAESNYSYVYNSSASAITTLGKISDVSISESGIMTWTAYSGAETYNITVNKRTTYSVESPFDLGRTIDRWIKLGELEKSDSYSVTLIAADCDDVNIAEWSGTCSYKSNASPIQVGTIANVSISNGIMTWDTYSGAVRYGIFISTNGYGASNTNSYRLEKNIDRMIRKEIISKSQTYTIEIKAYDEENDTIATWKGTHNYNSTAIAGQYPSITGIKVSEAGILTWDAYADADCSYYYVYIGTEGYSVDDGTSFELNSKIDYLIKHGTIENMSPYAIRIVAFDNENEIIAKSDYSYTYESTAIFKKAGKISANLTSGGILTWTAYEGTEYYTVSICDCSYEVCTRPKSFELNKWINRLIKEGHIQNTGSFPVKIEAVDVDGILIAEWSQTYTYKTDAALIVVGSISNPVISNGVLSWDPYDGASSYTVYIESSGQGVQGTSFELNKEIDRAIKSGTIEKKSPYTISITACDSDDIVIARCTLSEAYKYDSPAERIECGMLNASIENGILKWEPYANAYKYILVINSARDEDYVFNQPTPVKLNEAIYSLNSEGFSVGMTDYSITLYAYDSDGITLAEWSGNFDYVRSANPMTVAPKTAKVKYRKVRKKTRTVARSKVLTIKNANGTLTYRKLSGKKKILINAKNGTVTVKKKLRRGTYKVKVQVTTSGNAYYLGKTKIVTFKIKVK